MFFSIILSIAVLLTFPIVIYGEIYLDIRRNKYAVSLSIYRIFRFLGGYFELYSKGFVLHKNEKTAVLIPITNITTHKKRFSFLDSFRLTSIVCITETGAESFLFCDFIRRIENIVHWIKPNRKNATYKIWLTDTNALNTSVELIFYSNLLIVVKNLIEFLREKLKILWQKKVKISTI